MTTLRQVMLMAEVPQVLEGIRRYAASRDHWSLCVNSRRFVSLQMLRCWKGDGIIFRSSDRATIEAIRRKRVPAVDTNCGVVDHGFPLVYADDNRIAELAVSHFLEQKFQNFAFCAIENPYWVQWRREAFLRELKRLGCRDRVSLFGQPAERSWKRQQRDLAEWVVALPKPVAILAANDVNAARLITACNAAGVRVPQDAAVLGVDNDEVLCELTTPRLSSIAKDMVSTGYQAASLLDELMAGGAAPRDVVPVPPRGVVARQSTDAMAVDDGDVFRAVRFIREHACEGIDTADVLRALSISRTTLERKFAVWLQTTPRQIITQVRTQRAKSLLTETDHSIKRIAQLTGYCTPSHLTVAFKRETGLTPGEYRQQARGR